MKIYILYHPHSELARTVEMYAHDFERSHGKAIDLVSVDTREGAATASLYDVVQYPAMLAIADDGHMQTMWQGERLPLMDEVAGYLNS